MFFKKRWDKYQQTFKSEHGKFVLAEILKSGHIFSSTFVKDNDRVTAFKEGERAMALRILSVLNLTVSDVDKLIREHNKHKEL